MIDLQMTRSTLSALCKTAFVCCLAFFTAGCGSKDEAGKTPKGFDRPVNIEGWVVRATPISEGVEVSGTILPMEETVLMPEVSGRAVRVDLPEGGYVARGTLLVKLFDEDLVAQLKKLETQLRIAEQTEARQKELLQIQGISQQDYDLSQLQVENLKAEMDLVRIAIRRTELRAPFDGQIGLRRISVGAYLTTSTPVATIRAMQRLKMDFSVPEKYASIMKPGFPVRFTVEGDSSVHGATVYASEKSIDASARSLTVRAQINGGSQRLAPGMYASVKLTLAQNPQAILVPTEAVIPQAREKKVVIVKNGRAKFVTVETGIREAARVEVVKGLSPGDTLVVKGVLFMKPDTEVKLFKVS